MTRTLIIRCLVVGAFAFAADVIACIHIRSLVENQLLVSTSTVLALHLMAYFSLAWFTDAKNPAHRWWITIAGGVGAAVGTAAVICLRW